MENEKRCKKNNIKSELIRQTMIIHSVQNKKKANFGSVYHNYVMLYILGKPKSGTLLSRSFEKFEPNKVTRYTGFMLGKSFLYDFIK